MTSFFIASKFSRQTKSLFIFSGLTFNEFFPHFNLEIFFVSILLVLDPNEHSEIYRENIEVNFCVLSRFGWYIPESFAEDNAAILDHWRAFTDPELTTLFAPTQSDLNFILPRLKDGNER